MSAGLPISIASFYHTHKTACLLALVMGLALGLRLLFIWQWQHTPFAGPLYLDAAAYDQWAQQIQGGHWASERAFYQSPLFPYLLSVLYTVTGHSALNVMLMNAVLGTASCGLLAYAAGRTFGTRALLLTGLLAAMYACSIFYTALVLKETVSLFLFSLCLVFTLLALETNRRRHYAAAGIFLGLSIITRGNALFLLPALPLLAWRYKKPGAMSRCAIHIFAVLLVMAPITIHNAVVSRDFVPVNYSGGLNFYLGNRLGANGANAYPTDVPLDASEEKATTRMAEKAAGRPLKPSEVSRFWFDKGWAFLAANPVEGIILWLSKATYFLSDTEFSDNYNVDFFRREMDTLLSWPLFPGFAVLLGLCVFAYAASDPAKRRAMLPFLLMAGLYMTSVLPFYVTDRYRLPVIVFLLPLAGAAALPVFSGLKRHRVAVLLAVMALGISALYPPRDPRGIMVGWLSLGSQQLHGGQDHAAAESLSRAIAVAPIDVDSYWYVEAAKAEDRAGNHANALRLFDAALRAHPEDEQRIRMHYPERLK